MTPSKLSVAIVGAGIGGLAAAGTLRRAGFTHVNVYEQASGLARIGAGIEMTPSAMKALRAIGVEERLRQTAFAPCSQLDRASDSGEILGELPIPESLFGAPYLCMHRGDLHDALASVVPPENIHLGKKLLGLAQAAGEVTLAFANGTQANAELVIGADGVHSTVRDIILDHEKPMNTGRVAYRAVFPASRMGGKEIGSSRTKWRGSDRHIVICYTTAARSEICFEANLPEPGGSATRESWSAKGDMNELRAAYSGFHPDVRAVLEACSDCYKRAVPERAPLARWSDGGVVLLGDACYSMTPHMAQSAASSIEDAAILARCLETVEGEDIEGALKRYEAHRKLRT